MRGKMGREDVGKVLLLAGADDNLLRPRGEGITESRGGGRTDA
jgi:hypothetical protein